MTLRQLIKSVDLDIVFKNINARVRNIRKKDVPLEETVNRYKPVIRSLLKKPKAKKYKYSILFYKSDEEVCVCLLNPKYIDPPEHLKPWYGRDYPVGCYNAGLKKYTKTFSMSFVPWKNLIDTPIVNNDGISDEIALMEFLWELTFYGHTEADMRKEERRIYKQIKESNKNFKEGKFVTISSMDSKYKIEIPENIIEKLKEI